MCGLVGIASGFTLSNDGSDFLAEALYADQLRGKDSTGVALVDKDNNVSVFKKALSASDFLDHRIGQEAIRTSMRSYIAIGHNRATTIGSSTTANAHPFHYGRFVGAHNGTIREHKDIFSVSKYTVDSENLIASLDNDKDPASTLAKIHSGAFAITVYDDYEQHMIFARNDKRPLYLLQLEDKVLWASEMGMLHWLAIRNNLIDSDKKKGKVIAVPENTILRYNCDTLEFEKREKFTPDSAPVYNNASYKYNRGRGLNTVHTSSSAKSASKGSYTLNTYSSTSFQGIPYDYRFDGDYIKPLLQIDDVSGWSFLPMHYVPYGKDGGKPATTYGSAHGLVYSPDEDVMFPATMPGIRRDLYDDWQASGCFLVARFNQVYATKEGNLQTISLVNLNEVEHGSESQMWMDPAVEAWNEYCNVHNIDCGDKEYPTYYGLCYNSVTGQMVELNDTLLRRAYKNAKAGKSLTEGVPFEKKSGAAPSQSATKSTAGTAAGQEAASTAEKKSGGGATTSASTAMVAVPSASASKNAQQESTEDKEGTGNVVAGNFRSSSESNSNVFQGPNGDMDQEEWFQLTENGCSVCAATILPTDDKYIAWDTTDPKDPKPLCVHCTAQFADALADASERGEAVTPLRTVS